MTAAKLTIEFQPDGDGFLRAEVSVSCGGFGGRTEVPIARRDLGVFAAEVDAMERGEADLAQLIGGWDAGSEKLRLRIARAGTTDSFTVRVTVANVGLRNDQWHRVETQFVSGKASMLEFVRHLGEGDASAPAALVGDADSIA